MFDYRNNCVILGVNVNIQDYAGWTPMHEACNHGSTQCVKELLHFVPAKTVEYYCCKGAYQYCDTSTKIRQRDAEIKNYVLFYVIISLYLYYFTVIFVPVKCGVLIRNKLKVLLSRVTYTEIL